MKYYAVKNGRAPGIYTSWDECAAQVNGFSGAVYKSFASKGEAEAFITGVETKPHPLKIPTAYVDGSYNAETGVYGSGALVLVGGEEITLMQTGSDAELASMHNVAGEVLAAQLVMEWCVSHSIPEITICHDYEGVAAWAEGRWKTNKEGTKAYKEYYDSISTRLLVHFVKVKAHSGDKYNDLADELAKKAAGI